ncbi:MAG: hypothetical protein IJS00_06975 [Paludibacteraceae bacterium]|nr:hypothetical protein [Paludibacteraceae bacterium]
MPYRRLPNTDQSRLNALQTAIQSATEADFTEQVLPYHTVAEAQRFIAEYQGAVVLYHENFNSRISANKQYRKVVQNARMYISHFIQVLNLAVIRGEIKKEQKELYHLDTNNHFLPDLSSEEDLLEWGKNIIDGEQERTRLGGFPIYNPAINKVRVHYDIFKEQHIAQQLQQKNVTRVIGDIEAMRQEADRIILAIWNKVEEYYKDLLPYARMRACQNYGVVYYYRSGEKRFSEQTDRLIRQAQEAQGTLPLQ